MSQDELSYDETKQEIVKMMEGRGLKILATSDGNLVTAREIRFVSDGLKMYFITDHRSRKYQQISVNPNVAVAVGNLQTEGLAKIRGHPKDDENKEFLEAFQRREPEVYERWSKSGHFENPNHRVIEVIPQRISVYKSKSHVNVPKTHIVLLDAENEKAFKIELEDYPLAPAYKKQRS